jgi:hypothetical protein
LWGAAQWTGEDARGGRVGWRSMRLGDRILMGVVAEKRFKISGLRFLDVARFGVAKSRPSDWSMIFISLASYWLKPAN